MHDRRIGVDVGGTFTDVALSLDGELVTAKVPTTEDQSEGVIAGIGFLGAGSIIQSRGSVQGLTTGAAIWIAGAIGVACATGNLVLAGLLTGFALLIVVVLGKFEKRLDD